VPFYKLRLGEISYSLIDRSPLCSRRVFRRKTCGDVRKSKPLNR
jgi:hypothetical protein